MAEDTGQATPFQEEKKRVIDDTLAAKQAEAETEKRGVKKGVKRGPYKKKQSPKAKVETVPIESDYTEFDADRDSKFLTGLVNTLRMQAGLPFIKEMHAAFFEASSKSMFLKYGPSASRWMPEFMFAGSLFMILVDTRVEMLKLKSEQKEPETSKPAGKIKPEIDEEGKIQPTMSI